MAGFPYTFEFLFDPDAGGYCNISRKQIDVLLNT